MPAIKTYLRHQLNNKLYTTATFFGFTISLAYIITETASWYAMHNGRKGLPIKSR